MGACYVVDAVRTPVGKYGGALAGRRPDDLAAGVLAALLARNMWLDPGSIDDVFFGNANGAGEDSRNVARMAVLLAGLPTSVPAVTVNRLCGSGLEAVIDASRAIETGDAAVCVAGGVESMSRAPWVIPKPEQPFPRGHQTMYSTTLGWRMTNPRMPSKWTISLGEGAELLAERFAISREEQDAFALQSHQRALEAWKTGIFDREVVRPDGIELERDESIRPDTSAEALSRLQPSFRTDGKGTVTAGNSSPLSDGAAAVLLVGESVRRAEPLGRIAARAATGIDPDLYGLGPVEAADIAVRRAGIRWSDLRVVELNEAFAAQALACLRHWPELNPEIVNVHGGAIAIGHPLGASGVRILTTLLWELRRRGGGYGLAAICIGVGQGLAVVVEA
ncbi:MAG: thiolase family protein [Acidothermus sp.]|nr:thiolase family protein [Acidothermus sp.]